MRTLYKSWCDPTYVQEDVEAEGEEENKVKEATKPDFKEITNLCQSTKFADTNDKTSYEQCLLSLLEAVFELKEEELVGQLDKFILELAESKIISSKSFNGGVSKFAQMIPGIAADIPHLCKVFARCVLIPLCQKDYLKVKDI